MRIAPIIVALVPVLFVVACADGAPPGEAALSGGGESAGSAPADCTCDDLHAALEVTLDLGVASVSVGGSATYDPTAKQWIVDQVDALELPELPVLETLASATIDVDADACTLHCSLADDAADCAATCELGGGTLVVDLGGTLPAIGDVLALDLADALQVP